MSAATPVPLAMTSRLSLLTLLVCAAVAAATAPAADAVRASCVAGGYAYAGLESKRAIAGVAATLSMEQAPQVANGHVAAWVGVGGEGFGPAGSDVWLQVGLAGFPDGRSELYYELALPGQQPRYTLIAAGVRSGTRYRVAVRRSARVADAWRVVVDGRAVTEPIVLPGSKRGWSGVATAEAWQPDASGCNRFRYRFDDVSVAGRGGDWAALADAWRFQGGGTALRVTSPSAFVASAGS